jgi:hypothetical protein
VSERSGMNCKLERLVRRPSGWKVNGRWWTRDSKHGVRYMCPECGKQALGTTFQDDRHHHWPSCPRLTPNNQVEFQEGGEAE